MKVGRVGATWSRCTGASCWTTCARAPRSTCICQQKSAQWGQLAGAACSTWRLWPASSEIILCEAIIDALTFWCAGYRNVTTAYGIEGFTDEMLSAFKQYGIERVLIAYDRDEAGERGAAKVAQALMAVGIECFRIQFPKGMDANEYARKVTPADKSLGLLIRKAVWLGKGEAPVSARG